MKSYQKVILHPQEIETYYILPALRRHFAIALKKKGLKQKTIAEMMGIKSSAISQYKRSKRGHQIKFPPLLLKEIGEAALRITDRLAYFKETQHILRRIREESFLCEVHHQFSVVPSGCDPQKIGCHTEPGHCSPIKKMITPLSC
ncbi:hypothetical protein HYX12_02365 [Candidatus Woesearchaeota archaeon]|nr:hypothetical protein [Candidatus Woesearchaeota archaeon]